MDWILLLTASALLALWLSALGELGARALGIDEFASRCVAPVVAFGLIGVTSILTGELAIPWRPIVIVPLLVALVLAAAIASPLSRRALQQPILHAAITDRIRGDVPLTVGVLACALLQVGVLWTSAEGVTAINQNNDAIFHLNLIAEIRNSAQASPLIAPEAITGGEYYPNAFHALAALVGTSMPVPLSYNIVMLTVSGFLFTTGVGRLARALERGTLEVIIAPSLACSTIWFPWAMLNGNAQVAAGLSVALIPGVLAGMIHGQRRRDSFGIVMVAAVSAIGLGVAHPGGLQWAILFGSVLILINLRPILNAVRIRRSHCLPARLGLILFSFAPIIAMMAIPRLETMGSYPRLSLPSTLSIAAPFLLPMKDQPVWMNVPLLVLGGLGLVILARQGRPTPLIAWAVCAGLVWITFLPTGLWTALVGAWWGDPNRYYAIEAMLLGVGATALIGGVTRSARNQSSAWGRGLIVTVALLALVFAAIPRAIRWTNEGYSVTERKYPAWLTVEEKEWMIATAQMLPDDALVYGDPQTGAAFFSVFTDVESANRFQGTPSGDDEREYLADNFHSIGSDPHVCEAISRIGGSAYFYTDSSIPQWMTEMTFPGYTQIDFSSGFEAVSTLGNASLWRISACENQ